MNTLNFTRSSTRMAAGLLFVAVLVGACSSATTSLPNGGGLYGGGPTQAVAGATQAVVATPVPAAAGATLLAKAFGSQTLLVAGSNGMTVYTFTKDTAGSGSSACTAGCLTKWPAVTVAAGTAPTAGDGVMGTVATITRPDDGSLQVTYNGLPLYFFAGDKAVGDTNGSYTNWNLVKP
jgi:predicted lipoprotein with Yx(FWY)xxD motif